MKKSLLIFICILIAGVILAACGLTPDETAVPPAVPAAPSGIAVEAISWCSIVISWQDNSISETGFIISRSEYSDFQTYFEITIDPNRTSYIDRGTLSATSTYYYRIRAVNSSGDSSDSLPANDTTLEQPSAPSGSLIADHSVINWVRQGNLPIDAISNAKNSLHIGYGHTSHGSQLTSGMSGLVAFANGTGCAGQYTASPNLFSWNRGGTGGALDLREGDGYGSGDLDHDAGYNASDWETNGHHSNWYRETREYLDNPDNSEINVIIWSWCGQVSGYSEQTMIDTYLAPMTQLETDYPDVIFVYMTGHLNGTGTTGNLHLRNDQIRQYCSANNKWLFDFADIECYDPDRITNYDTFNGNDACYWDSNNSGVTYHPENVAGTEPAGDANWALVWQAAHTVDEDWYDCGAAHSVSVNANMKAYAAWWLWARLAGWDGN